MASPRATNWLKWAAIAFVLLVVVDVILTFTAEGLWFNEVGFLQVFWLRLQAQGWLFLLGFGVSAGAAVFNLNLALKLRSPALADPTVAKQKRGLQLRGLLLLTLGLGLLMGLQLVHQAQVVATHWQPQLSVYSPGAPVPILVRLSSVGTLAQQLLGNPWQVAVMVAVAGALLVFPFALTRLMALLMSLGYGLVLSAQWMKVLPVLAITPFDIQDPIFNHDLSFYVFWLPLAELMEFWLMGLLLFLLVAVMLSYLLSGNSLSQGYFPGFSPRQQRHIYGLGSALLLLVAFSHWLARYEQLFSSQGAVFGAGYTDVTVVLPVNTGLAVLSTGLGVGMLWRTVFWSVSLPNLWDWLVAIARRKHDHIPPIQQRSPGVRSLILGAAAYGLVTLIGIGIVPWTVQQLIVLPNELLREAPFINRAISFTRSAFQLDTIEEETFIPGGQLTAAILEENDLTVRNIRLWDKRPLLESNRQLQQIRLYYEFFDADVDRYTLRQSGGGNELRQVLIAAREMNYDRVPDQAKTWVNEHLIYTHGYGFTMSPVNVAGPGGLPEYFIQDIAHTASEEAADIPIGQPRIYYGELTQTYVMTDTQVQELDFPDGNDNVYNTYDGDGGIGIGGWPIRLLFSRYLRDWQMLFTEDFTPDTQLLFRRNIVDRVQTIAPFLRYDQDPYLVVADLDQPFNNNPDSAENYLYWVIDAYTTSDRYPYADPGQHDFNYIRNSVKVVIDAYHGTTRFFVAEPDDPVIQTWSQLFPEMLEPLTDMPTALISHIRYPQDFFQVQSDELMTYHMTDAQVFYNREDQWRAPNEVYANELREVEPYYLIMKLPTEDGEEFILLRPFTPVQRNNLVAWIAARADGDRYGRMLLYRFPKQELVFGPEQVEARINQDPLISQRISLWNTQGSQANQGNLLVIPIERSLLYVEPLYLEAAQNRLPTLARVIAVHENRIAMAPTLDRALEVIFDPSQAEDSDAILRELDIDPEDSVPLLPE